MFRIYTEVSRALNERKIDIINESIYYANEKKQLFSQMFAKLLGA